ncbi:hypothetical protein CBER1_02470 [Cercospora berteroae]|uniref:Cytochrome P450 n=1 Tax=Cercospora berteroae TaxID=357750 RepID=A0A2S6C440_9PEZI|nr:hypothetical protein CBER1_02470 [Cercospora berteroae]
MEIKEAAAYIFLHRYAFYLLYYPILAALGLIVSIFAVIIVLTSIRISRSPKDIPWTGLKNKKIFPKLRACLREIIAGREPFNEGYERFSKNDKLFVIPNLLWTTVILPPSQTAWVASQPEHVLSGNAVLDEAMGLDYLAHGPNADSVRDFTVIRRHLTRHSGKLAGEVLEEIELGLDEELGAKVDASKKADFVEVQAMDILQAIAFRAANRIFVGPSLSRSKSYRKRIQRWTTAYGLCTIVMRFIVASPLKQFFMRVVAIPTKAMQWLATSEVRAMVKQRLSQTEAAQEQKNDMMQWIIETNAQKNDAREMAPQNIAGKMILFNLFATGTTSAMSALVLQDILHYEDAANLMETLRQEALEFLPRVPHDPVTALRSMTKMDSVIRESLRFNPLGAQSMLRKVVAEGGVQIKTSEGVVHLPQGTHVAVQAAALHRDPEVFGPDAAEYRPLRHYQQQTAPQPEKLGIKLSSEAPQHQQASQTLAIQISESFLSFGLGRHACPGRFFAINTMKLILGALLIKYEILPAEKGEEKKSLKIGEAIVPSEKWVVKLKRREEAKKEERT